MAQRSMPPPQRGRSSRAGDTQRQVCRQVRSRSLLPALLNLPQYSNESIAVAAKIGMGQFDGRAVFKVTDTFEMQHRCPRLDSCQPGLLSVCIDHANVLARASAIRCAQPAVQGIADNAWIGQEL